MSEIPELRERKMNQILEWSEKCKNEEREFLKLWSSREMGVMSLDIVSQRM